MVRVVSWQSGPPQCGPLPGPRSAATFWLEATAAERANLTLPAFSLRSSKPHSAPEGPGASFAAACSACGCGAVAVPAEGLHTLRNIHGRADAIKLQPQTLNMNSRAGQRPAVPSFLVLRRRTPCTDAWLSSSAATLDVPCLPSSADLQPHEQVRVPDFCKEHVSVTSCPPVVARTIAQGCCLTGVNRLFCCRPACLAPSCRCAM